MPGKALKSVPKEGPKKTAEALTAGKRIRDARDDLDLSLEQLEEKTGRRLSASRIGNYEQGLRELGIAEAHILAAALGQPAAYLMGLIDEQERDLLLLPPAARAAFLLASQALNSPSAH
jgi:transcriptional regulator with XRE-family HTH domain